MFIPRNPEELSFEELNVELNKINDHIQELTWLQTKLEDIIMSIDVVLPVYTATGQPGNLAMSLEDSAGQCMRALNKISRRQLTMRDFRAQCEYFLKEEEVSDLPKGGVDAADVDAGKTIDAWLP